MPNLGMVLSLSWVYALHGWLAAGQVVLRMIHPAESLISRVRECECGVWVRANLMVYSNATAVWSTMWSDVELKGDGEICEEANAASQPVRCTLRQQQRRASSVFRTDSDRVWLNHIRSRVVSSWSWLWQTGYSYSHGYLQWTAKPKY